MLTSVDARPIVALAAPLSVTLNEMRLSTSAQSRSCTRTTFVVSPGMKMRLPVPGLTKSAGHALPDVAVTLLAAYETVTGPVPGAERRTGRST